MKASMLLPGLTGDVIRLKVSVACMADGWIVTNVLNLHALTVLPVYVI